MLGQIPQPVACVSTTLLVFVDHIDLSVDLEERGEQQAKGQLRHRSGGCANEQGIDVERGEQKLEELV